MILYRTAQRGFTLIELSIVLVIIGLIVGGILVGRDLISAAAVRAQVTQIEKYQSAVNTFLGKYSYLPGDIPDPGATQYGFKSRGSWAGEGDGNGLVEGNAGNVNSNSGTAFMTGETMLFWEDLTIAKLIDGSFSAAAAHCCYSGGSVTGSGIDLYFPQAKIGGGNYVYAFSYSLAYTNVTVPSAQNYFGLSAISSLATQSVNSLASNPGLSVVQAYNIDRKIDDGLPLAGRVQALYLTFPLANFRPELASGGGVEGTGYGNATPPSSTTCYDNNNVSGTVQGESYSLTQNKGAGINCALVFRMGN